MIKTRVGVLRGGPGAEYEVSLKTGAAILGSLSAEKYQPLDIFVDRGGQWHFAGLPTNPNRLARQVDLVFNALHGEFGEDGRVQALLEAVGIPYTGSGILGSALGMKKNLAKQILSRLGVRTPLGTIVEAGPDAFSLHVAARLVFNKISPPWVVKPNDSGSSVGLFLARDFRDLTAALAAAAKTSPRILVEEYIKGREATVGVVENFRGERLYVLPAIEIRRPGNKPIWDYEDKYSGETGEVCPATFGREEKEALSRLARFVHQTLGLRHYSRSDFIVSPRGIYWLEVNTLPGLTPESLFPKALGAIGVSLGAFVEHLLVQTLDGN